MSDVERRFDVVIVGSGPGGYKTAKLLLERGLRVCVVERSLFGGTCLNAGCIPKDYLYNLSTSLIKLRGASHEVPAPSWKEAVSKAQERVSALRKSAEEYLRKRGLEIVYGEGELVDEKVVKVGSLRLVGDRIVLACGSKPKEGGVSPEDLLTGRILPEGKILIKGEGPSACELAFVLRAFGFEVSILIKDRLLSSLPQIPESFSAKLEAALERMGVEVVEREVRADTIVVATGREPNLCPETFPFIRRRSDGFVEVNEHLETSVPDVYAVGDIVPPMGAGFAFEKARVVAHNLVEESKITFEPAKVPLIITSAYEVGFVGDPDRAVRTENIPMSLNPKNFVNHEGGILRIGYDEGNRPVFLCGIGHGVSEVLNVYSSLTGGSFSHPSYAELIEELTKPACVRKL